jgi:HK97 family phage prohead protease
MSTPAESRKVSDDKQVWNYDGRVYRKFLSGLEAKVAKTETGEIQGYLASYGNIDRGGERIFMGAFAKSIREKVAAGKIPLMSKHMAHGGGVEDVIGVIKEAEERPKGLWIRAVFAKDTKSQDIRQKIMDGMVWGLSVGYRMIKWDDEMDRATGRRILNLRELALVEGTVTVNPMNEEAVIMAAKSIQEELAGSNGEHPASQASIDRLSEAIELLTGKQPLETTPVLDTESDADWAPIDGLVLQEQAMRLSQLKLEMARKDIL